MEERAEELLHRWEAAGLLSREQADSIRLYEAGYPRRVPGGAGQSQTPPRAAPERPRRRAGSRGQDQSASPGRNGGRAASSLPLGGLPAPRIDARLLGLVLGTLAALGVLGAALSFVTDLFVAPNRLISQDLEESLHFAASAIALIGSLWIYNGRLAGRGLVLLSLAINIGATVLLSSAKLLDVSTVLPLLVWVGLFYLTAAARLTAPRDQG